MIYGESSIQDQLFNIREANLEDDQTLKNLISVPLATRGVMMSFQREPSYFKASDVLYKTKLHVLIEEGNQKKIVACYSNGHRPCYINGKIKNLRYVCDLRVDQNHRGKSLVKMLGTHVRETMHDPNYSQVIIFSDNHAARAAIQTNKIGMPRYYDEGLVETLTLTYIPSTQRLNKFLANQSYKYSNTRHINQKIAQLEDIPLMNEFIREMSEYYNFLPAYNFEELQSKDPYFSELNITDFTLYFVNNKIVGMFGLWDQHKFKQTKIMSYGKIITLIRPFYNLISKFQNNIHLPKKGESFKYHMLHSLLCHPKNLALHHRMVTDAFKQSKSKGIGVVSFTISHKDPRYQLNQFYKGERLIGMHGFISFEVNPLEKFISNLIPYFDVGRI